MPRRTLSSTPPLDPSAITSGRPEPREFKRGRLVGERPPSYVSKATLAAELDIGESTVDDYVKRGALPKPIQFGGAVRWDWKQVDAALRSLASPETANIDLFMAGIDNVKAE